MVLGYQSNYGIHGFSDKGVDQYILVTMVQGYQSNYGIHGYSDKGVDQEILVTVNGPGIPE